MKRNINFTGLFFLLLYVFSNSPAILFHHHDYSIVAYDKADKCEKAIYYSEQGSKCNHKEHVTKAFEKCSLCDNHTLSAHTNLYPDFVYSKVANITKFQSYKQNFHSLSSSENSNRGPPKI